MSTKKHSRKIIRRRLHKRIRSKITGTKERPRVSVFFSEKHICVQVIDDEAQKTLLAISTTEKSLRGHRPNVADSAKIGKQLAERAKAKGISEVVFDRAGFKYHGKVKALADAAREGGLKF